MKDNDITSLAIIPELSCNRSCTYCYEKHKTYGKAISDDDFINTVIQTLEKHENIKEVLIDHSPPWTGNLIKRIIDAVNIQDILITTTPDAAVDLIQVPYINFSISLHNTDDMIRFYELFNHKRDRISCITIMIEDLDMFEEVVKDRRFTTYIMANKFANYWKNFVKTGTFTPELSLKLRNALSYNNELDHCISTLMNKQECPASSQINIYKDGTERNCPYMIQPGTEADYSKGCHLVSLGE